MASLENIVNDLDSIGFYSELKLSIILLVSIVAFLNSFLIITFIFDKFNFTDLTKLLNYTLMLFFINTGVTFFVLYISTNLLPTLDFGKFKTKNLSLITDGMRQR